MKSFLWDCINLQIIKGQFRTDDYDFCVAHVDMASYILPLRGILRTKFPTRFNGEFLSVPPTCLCSGPYRLECFHEVNSFISLLNMTRSMSVDMATYYSKVTVLLQGSFKPLSTLLCPFFPIWKLQHESVAQPEEESTVALMRFGVPWFGSSTMVVKHSTAPM